MPPPPEAREAEIRYSVVVANQPVRDVLLAMARETRVNFDIHPGIDGTVNLNAIDQTLKQILNRIARQVDLRWEMEGQTITVMPDTPFLRNYRVDYVNLARDVSETIGIATQIISGKQDWGANRGVGGPEKAGQRGFTKFKGVHMVDGGGHWVHEEQPEIVSQLLTSFLHATA